MTSSNKRVALITGCSEPNSIGANLTIDLLHRGWTVYATARKIETLTTLRGAGAEVLALDVVDKDSIAHAKQVITEKEGRLDALVNNVSRASSSSSRGQSGSPSGILGRADRNQRHR